ncbi:MAG TPA: site-2 protease family protein [Cellulomonas sp.]
MSANRPEPSTAVRGWVIGRVAGAPVVLSPSFLLAAVVLTAAFTPSVRSATGLGAGAYVVALVFVLLLFGSVFCHELAHGLVGRARGQQPTAFVLTLWGGHTSFRGAASTPATAALVAAAGPVTNLVLAVLFLVLSRLAPDGSLAQWVLLSGAFSSGFVGVFNLLPGLPLDGGQLLEAAVWAATKDRTRGTVAAAWCGRVVAVGVVAWAVVQPMAAGRTPSFFTIIWTVMVAAFLWSGASQVLRGAHQQRAVQGLSVQGIGRPAVAVGFQESVAAAGARAAAAGASEVVVLSPDGRPAAYVDTSAAASVPREQAGLTPVTAVAVPLPVGAVVDGRLSGEQLLAALSEASRLSPVLVALIDGRVAALIRTPDVVAAIRP